MSKATRVPDFSFVLSSCRRQPTTYRGPFVAFTITIIEETLYYFVIIMSDFHGFSSTLLLLCEREENVRNDYAWMEVEGVIGRANQFHRSDIHQ